MVKKFWIAISEYEIKREIKKIVKQVLRDTLTYGWIKKIIEDEIRSVVRIKSRK